MGFGILPAMFHERRWFAHHVSGLWEGLNKVWDHLNVEIKSHDTVQTSLVNINTTTPTFYELTDIDAGITGNSTTGLDVGYRDGDKIRVRSVHIKGEVVNPIDNGYSQTVNLFLVKHYDNFLGGAVSYDELYDSNTGILPTMRLRNSRYAGQYKILRSRKLTLGAGTTKEDDIRSSFDMYLRNKRKGSFVEWEGTSGDSPSNGKYYLVAVCDTQGSSGSNPPQLTFATRVTYVDN